jgi:hypothetical protein
MCVLEVSILPLSTILIFDFGTVRTVWYFFFTLSFLCNPSTADCYVLAAGRYCTDTTIWEWKLSFI